jgi:hypothetical protein
MENTTETNQIQQDWYKAAMIFAKALGLILDEDQGIIVDLNDTTKIPELDEVNKVIVFRKDNQVHIAPCTEDIAEGETVILNPTEPTDELPDGV